MIKINEYYFDKHAYDVFERIINNPAWLHIHLSKVDSLIKALDLPSKSRVLDVGCGTGYASLLHNGFNNMGVLVDSIDISKASVKKGKNYSYNLNKFNEFILGSALRLPFKDNSFNAAYCIGMLHHISYHHLAIKEMARVSYKVCCIEPNNLNPMIRRYQKTEIAKRAGDTKAFLLSELVNDFKTAGLKNIKCAHLNCIFPTNNHLLLNFMIKTEPIFQRTPILNRISGSLLVYGEK